MIYAPERPVDGSQMILTAGPLISSREASYALDAARNGWNHRWSGYLKRFESGFAEYLGVKHAIATSSCTGALHLALLSLGVGPGDEVIVPDITWVATANAVVYTGATPVFADVDPESWTLDPSSFESKIGPRTKAVIPVHLYGHPADMDAVIGIARRHGLHVVEDAAPAIGAECRGAKAGTFGDLAAFSFQGAKLLVTGEGGMLVTNDTALYEKAILLWDQGRDPRRTFWINQNGWKYKMSNVQAAVGLGQLERVDPLIEAKRQVFSWYAEGLAGLPHVRLNHERPWARSIYWMTSLFLLEDAPIGRDDLIAALKAKNVDTRPVFPAISQYPIWPRVQEPQPNALRIGDRAINLPSGVCLRREQVEYTCRCIREALGA
jgi:perosamine synthetase